MIPHAGDSNIPSVDGLVDNRARIAGGQTSKSCASKLHAGNARNEMVCQRLPNVVIEQKSLWQVSVHEGKVRCCDVRRRECGVFQASYADQISASVSWRDCDPRRRLDNCRQSQQEGSTVAHGSGPDFTRRQPGRRKTACQAAGT